MNDNNKNMKFFPTDHTFALCSYRESPYLEDCILSLKSQVIRSNILIATSTPSKMIDRLGKMYDIPVFVNPNSGGIGADWNYAYQCAKTALVTITHQDDIYEPDFVGQLIMDLNGAKDPIIWFCDYYELRDKDKVHDNDNLRIKRLMLLLLKSKTLQNSRFVRRRVLSFGSPICCPSVTYVKEKCGKGPIFSTEMKVSLDWDQWEKQSRKSGTFVYCDKPLMGHRIHANSATSELIASNMRCKEDLEMYQRFWPEWIAKRLSKLYANSEKSNDV